MTQRAESTGDDCEIGTPNRLTDGNPLEMTSAFTFAFIFVAVLVATRFVVERFGSAGVLVMAAIMGAADVDPFILGLTQTVGTDLDHRNRRAGGGHRLGGQQPHEGNLRGHLRIGTNRSLSSALLACSGAVSVVLFLVL